MARLSLGWLKPPKVPADGVMSLGDHLRELRYRLIFSLVAIVIGMICCAFFYNQLVAFMMAPWLEAQAALKVSNPDLDLRVTLGDTVAPFLLTLKVVGFAGLVVTCPIWLYQIWAYIVPALLAREKKLALMFLGAAIPLFLFGVVVAYWVLPQGIIVMMQFTPDNLGVLNLFEMNNYLSFLLQLMLVFGIGFLIPVIVVALNMLGIVSGAALKKSRAYVAFGCFLFGAMATPGGDPFSMMALALPMVLLFLAAEGICHANDKRRAKTGSALAIKA